ncbi:hypothetical protein TNCV_3935121 [Trichonephila clavipes]|nr:hypothetical protein TNCV_3935121 [Trichonephila clavipes]
MHVKSVKAQASYRGVVRKLAERVQLRCRPCQMTWFKITRSIAKSLRLRDYLLPLHNLKLHEVYCFYGRRNFEPRSSDENDTLAGTTLSKLPHHSNMKTLNLDRFHMYQPLYMADLQ